MARQGTILLVLGGVLAAGIAAAVWLAMGETPSAETSGPSASVAAPETPDDTNGAKAISSRARAKRAGTASVGGEVRRSKGRVPVAGQEVQLVPEKGEPWRVATDARGRFVLGELPHGGPYELRIAAPGCGTIRIPGIALDRNEKRDLGTLWLDPSVKLTVEVRTWADAPVAGALVEAYAAPQAADFDWTRALAQAAQTPVAVAKVPTDAQGRALFPELAVGRWTFTATKAGHARAGRANVTLRSDVEPAPVKLHLGTGHSLAGKVTDTAKMAVPGAQVMAGPPNAGWDLGSSALRARTTTDAEGRYSFASLEAGDTVLWVARPGGGMPFQVATLKIPNVTQFDIVLKGVATIAGAVTERENGKPVEGAKVRAHVWGGMNATFEGTTNAEGRYFLEVAEGTVNQVTAEKEGLVPAEEPNRPATPLRLHEGDTVTRDLALRQGSRLRGVVSGPEGPIADAKVYAHTVHPGGGMGNQKAATTDAEGRYEMTSLVPGKLLVRAEKEGFYVKDFPDNWWMAAQQPQSAPQFKVDVAAGAEAVKDLQMTSGVSIQGRVEGPDGPLAGVRVWLQQQWWEEAGVITGADGAFRLDGVKPASGVNLYAAREGYALVANRPVAVPESGAEGVVLRMGRVGIVRGTVTSADGSPLVDAAVRVVPSYDGGQGFVPMPSISLSTLGAAPVRPDGSYEIPLAQSMQGMQGGTGRFQVAATAAGRAAAYSEVVPIVEGQEAYTVNVTMSAGRDLEGVAVSKRGGAGVAGALVSIQYRQPSRETMARGFSMTMPSMMGAPGRTVWAVADAEGRFTVANLQPGSYGVSATAEGFVQGYAEVDLAQANRVTVEMEPELTIEGTVALADGTPVEGANLNAMRHNPAAGGTAGAEMEKARMAEAMVVEASFAGSVSRVAPPMGGGWSGGGGSSAMTGRGGRFRIPGLTTGSYRIRVSPNWSGDVNIKQMDTDPIAAGSTGVKITVELGGIIAGRVLDPQRQPLAFANVSARPDPRGGRAPAGPDWRSAQTGADGTFQLAGLSAPSYVVSVNAQSMATTYRPAERAGVAVGTTNLEIVLEPGLSITGTLVDAEGKPIPHVHLQLQAATPGGGGGGGGGGMVVHALGDGMTYSFAGGSMTGPDGAFTFGGLAPGEFSISMPEWDERGLVVENGSRIAAGTQGVRLVASKGLTITGVVVDEGNAPLEGVGINATTKNRDRWRNARTKKDGSFELTGLTAGTAYVITARVPGRTVGKVADVQPGAQDVRLVCSRGTETSGSVVNEKAEPMRNARIQFALVGDPDQSQSARADAEGRFTVSGLVPDGVYQVSVQGRENWGQIKAGDRGVELKPTK